jgi:MFS family permease
MSARRPPRRGRGQRTRAPRPSTSAVLGAAVGGLIAGVLYGAADRLAWWVWVLLVVVGLAVGYLLYRRAASRPRPAAPPPTEAAEPPGDAAGPPAEPGAGPEKSTQ